MRDSDPVDSLLLMRVGLYFGPACFFILAELYERHLADPEGAEQQYLEARRGSADPRRQFTATNALIDLYRRTGRRDRLTVELARFAERYRGTPHGEAAARELKELKAEARG